jgi:RNA-directed DNA polymerase
MQGAWSEDGRKAPWVKSREPLLERKGSGSQSPHSSGEAANDRGAKEGRKVNSEQEEIWLHRLPPVPERATRGKDSLESCAENVRLSQGSRQVWTVRMLEALARGNEGRQWHTLIDKVWSPQALARAVKTVTARKGAAGVDGQTTKAFAKRGAEEIADITRLLREGRYEPRPVKRQWIEKPGSKDLRPLGIPTVRDRVVQSALLYVMEPIFEIGFAEHSYGFRPGRGARQAVERVESLLEAGNTWVVDADIKGYFDSIPQDQLLARVREKIADGRMLALLEKFLRQGVMETAEGWLPTESGTPQGAVISPLLANIYLNPLDHQMAGREREMTRYADDFVILCRTEAQAHEALAEVQAWMSAAGLTLHPDKTRIIDASLRGGFDFLGWHFERGLRWPREKSQSRFKDAIRQQTGRSDGRSLAVIIQSVNRMTRGWGNYFRGGVRNVPERLDGWLRMRLRSILRRRKKRKGRGHALDHQRYPNAYFIRAGLTFLITVTHPDPPAPRRT